MKMLVKCDNCNKEFVINNYRFNRSKNHYCSRKCHDDGMIGRKLKERVNSDYKSINTKGHRLYHRYVMEQHLGRKLKRFELVHHINGDKQDNRIENLEIVSPQEHNDIHLRKYPNTKKCVVCGKEFTPHKTKRKRNKVCSKECWDIIVKQAAKQRCKQVLQFSKNGEFIKEWESETLIQNNLGYYASNINKCCKGIINTAYGYIWRFKNLIKESE